MEILITGATGFLGISLCRRLEAEGHKIVKLGSRDCDLTLRDSLGRFNHTKFDHIFHLAAWTQAGDFCLYHSGEQWIINQLINTNVLNWWRRRQPQAKLIAMGTSCAYSPDLDLTEENYMDGCPIESLFTYAMTKRMLYAGLLAINKQFGLNYLCLVPSTLYGPGYHADGRQLHFIFDLIRKILRGKHYGEPVILWGDGYQKRELVFVEDFVSLMLRLNSSCSNELINIGAGEEHSIRYFAELICDIVDYDFESIRFDVSKYVGAKSKCLSIEKMKNLLTTHDMTPITTGIQRTIIEMKEFFL
jgi:GDP-L-fucose synthase